MDTQVPLAPDPAPAWTRARLRRRRLRRWIIALAGLGAAGLVVWRLEVGGHGAHRPDAVASQPQAPVAVATATTGEMKVIAHGVGTVMPLVTVTVKTQINGRLQYVAFTEGQVVHKGELLAQIDNRPYQAALAQYQGQLAHDQAQLKQAQADLARYSTLLKQDSIARQTADDQTYAVKQYQGSIAADEGEIQAQQLNIDYCRIVAPVDGSIGLRTVDPGNYVQTTDSTGIATITQLQPISVVFALPEDNLVEVLAAYHGNAPVPVTAYDRSDTHEIATGQLAASDNQVNTTTGTWNLRASFANEDYGLFPNQFVNAHLLVKTLHGLLEVPDAAIQRGAPGTFVYLVMPNETVSVRKVSAGISDGGRTQITDGLRPGDRVVTEGADRLSDGTKIEVAAGE